MVPIIRRPGANSSPAISRIRPGSIFANHWMSVWKHRHTLTCRFRKSLSSSLAGGFQWGE